MSQATRLPFGTALALAQRTLAAPLAAVLTAENITATDWFTLNALGLRGRVEIEELAALLATNGVSPADARDLVAGLERAGLVEVRGDGAMLSPGGAVRYSDLRDRIADVTRRVFARFDPARVESARALLQEIAALDADELTRQAVQ